MVNLEEIEQGKSLSYDRKRFEDKKAMDEYKKESFAGKQTTKDEYTGATVHLKKQNAENKYHKNANAHLANTDHIKPLKEGYEETKFNYFVSDEDVRKALNNSVNFAITNGKINQSKKDKSNSAYIENNSYIDCETKRRMLEQEKKANKNFRKDIRNSSIKNAFEIAKEGGSNKAKAGAKQAAISNVKQMLDGEEELDEALTDFFCTTFKSSVEGACSDVTEVMMVGGRERVLSVLDDTSTTKKVINEIFKDENMGLIVSIGFNAASLTYQVLNGNISLEAFGDRLIDESVNLALFYQLATIAAPYGFVAGFVVNFIASKALEAVDKWLEENCKRQMRIENYKRMEEMTYEQGKKIIHILERAREQYEIDTQGSLRNIEVALKKKDTYLYERAIKSLYQCYGIDVAISSNDEMMKFLQSANGSLILGDCVKVSY